MSDIKLFRTDSMGVTELKSTSLQLEKSLQVLIERNLEIFLGIRFLASEYSTGKIHGGRIDTLGIDENGSPVIIEYKLATNQNVINQGLFYLNWLMDRKAEFKFLVMERLDATVAGQIEWSNPRLICIARDFSKFDEEAIQQINRNIELIRYRRYGTDLLLLELVNATNPEPGLDGSTPSIPAKGNKGKAKTVTNFIEQSPTVLRDRYEALKAYLLALGDDVQMKVLAVYVAFKRIKNFACVEVHPAKATILVYLKLDPDSITLEPGFTRDVRKIGHYGTGELEVRITSDDDLERAKSLIVKSYEAS